MASVASKARLRFLASTTMNGCVTAHHASHVKSAVLGDGITRDADWVAHAWRGNSLSTLRRVGHKVAAMAASFHRSEKTYERHCKMEVDSSFAFRLSHVVDLASFKALGPMETLPFQQSRRRVSGSWSACPWPERAGPWGPTELVPEPPLALVVQPKVCRPADRVTQLSRRHLLASGHI